MKWDIISCGYALMYAYIHIADIMHMTRPSRVCDSRQVAHVGVQEEHRIGCVHCNALSQHTQRPRAGRRARGGAALSHADVRRRQIRIAKFRLCGSNEVGIDRVARSFSRMTKL